MSETETAIREAVRGHLRDALGVTPTQDDEALFSTGRIDSFGLVEILSFVESRFGVAVSPMDVTLENLDSVDAITALVAGLGGGAAST